MFLFWLFLALVLGVLEESKDRYDAYKYNKDGGFEAKHLCFKRDNNGRGIHN